MHLGVLQQQHVEFANINHRIILLIRGKASAVFGSFFSSQYFMLSTGSASMLLLLLALCLWSLGKKRAELFRFPLCPDFVVSVSDGRLSTCFCRQPVISLVRGAGSEAYSTWLMKKKKRKEQQHPAFSPLFATYWALLVLLLKYAWWRSCEQNAPVMAADNADVCQHRLPLWLSRLREKYYNKTPQGRLKFPTRLLHLHRHWLVGHTAKSYFVTATLPRF